MTDRNKKLIFSLLVFFAIPSVVIAQTMSSPSYNIENSTFDGGGQSSSSTNYRSVDSISDVESGISSSTNFRNPSGFQPGAYPGVPGQPTFVNTTGSMYNALDFVVVTGSGQQSDTTYAIAISDDDFTTTEFIQVDGTIGPNEYWQDYSGWGGATGETVVGLNSNTAYKIKVKASYGTGSNAADSESGYSQEASASTAGQTLTFAIGGVGSGATHASLTTTVASSANSIGFGLLTLGDGNPNIAAQTLTVTTNASGGYSATARHDQDLTSANSDTIATVSGTNASPAAFGTGVTTGRFGYHTTDSSLCTGTSSRFTPDDTFARMETTPYEVACSTGPVTSDLTYLVYKLVVGALQPAGDYQSTVTYIATATY
ncbi:MAG TPA: hypothetical protein PKD79_01720 [Candidatus Doudnabacteria bacterium]|nr:hypothetical protein [Candidatus Doudnabacteria bacterium]